MKWCILLIALLSVSCTQRMMTEARFHEIFTGETIASIEMRCGAPYEIKPLQNGLKEYLYIERVKMSSTKELFRFYSLIITRDGRVISKNVKELSSPSLQLQL